MKRLLLASSVTMKSIILICLCVCSIWAVPIEKKKTSTSVLSSFEHLRLSILIGANGTAENNELVPITKKTSSLLSSFEHLRLSILGANKTDGPVPVTKNKKPLFSLIKKLNLGIIGGNKAKDGQFPWHVSILVKTESRSFYCGGALVAPKWVLTAGKCVAEAQSFTLRLGSNSLADTDIHRVTVEANYSVAHPDFNPLTFENDIGLIRIDTDFPTNERIQVISLAYRPLESDVKVTVSGFGATSSEGGLSNDLYYADLSTISNVECRSKTGQSVSDQIVCAVGGNIKGVCVGDGGSPLVAKDDKGKFIHVGVSWWPSASGCETREPSQYTRTASFIEWIHSVINE